MRAQFENAVLRNSGVAVAMPRHIASSSDNPKI